MYRRRAISAAVLVLAATGTLAGCADDPADKAFGGLGDLDGPLPSGAPSVGPSTPPSLEPGGPGGPGGSTPLPTSPTSPGVPTYDSNAIGEAIGKNCRYSRASSQIQYDVDVQNSSSDTSFTYSLSVEFKIGSSPDSSVATEVVGSDFETVTVGPGGDRTVTLQVTHSTTQRLAFSCQVMTATKVPS
ncbi:hypothetical protein FM076_31400 [Streptomyces albus subsp. chlorinus]|uniref:hypothetical protein n=1 Tax=Streptomyces albus TaxID=1888 RepID=UPI00156EE3F0|nr:hypothetical protein [Streptomyces albus]NSC25416.1 hypothetical protein [Streptomyces albus subsp. chlorinus]